MPKRKIFKINVCKFCSKNFLSVGVGRVCVDCQKIKAMEYKRKAKERKNENRYRFW